MLLGFTYIAEVTPRLTDSSKSLRDEWTGPASANDSVYEIFITAILNLSQVMTSVLSPPETGLSAYSINTSYCKLAGSSGNSWVHWIAPFSAILETWYLMPTGTTT